jgi:hypothetical protein
MEKFLEKFVRNKKLFYLSKFLFWFLAIVYVGILPLVILISPRETAEAMAGLFTFAPLFITYTILYQFGPIGLFPLAIILATISLAILYLFYEIYKIRSRLVTKNDAKGVFIWSAMAVILFITAFILVFNQVPPIDL